jgi:transposase
MDTISSDGSDDRGEGRDDPKRWRRKSYTLDEKRRLVAESYEPGASVSRVARRHQINANLLFTWRRQLRPTPIAGPPMELIPVDIVGGTPAGPPRAAVEIEQRGAIEITLASGVRVRVDASVSEAALKRVLSALKAAT